MTKVELAYRHVWWSLWYMLRTLKGNISVIRYLGWFPYVGIYETWQDYGGPEEGGWWYDCGMPVEGRRVFNPFVKLYRAWLEGKCRGREGDNERPRYHFVYGTDIPTYYGPHYRVLTHPGEGKFFPEERPHYE